ncbi:MAG: NAD-dependent epimerase/dehydratase family protein [Patescibacteria group bacterium]
MSKYKILVTGSSGTIGTRFFEKLLEQGYEAVGFDKKQNQWDAKLNKQTIKGDLLREDDLKKLPKNIDLIIHLAANARVYNSVLNPILALENIMMTHHILEFARKKNIPRFILSSSREVYGNREESISSEDEVNIRLSESPYSAMKIGAEALVYAYRKCFGIQNIILRFSNVYGRYDISDRLIPLLIEKMRKDQDVFIYGKEKVLDFTYIDDCISGLIKTVEHFSQVQNNVLNIASGEGHTLIEVARLVREILGSKSRIIIKANRKGEVVQFIADISRAKSFLGYEPKYSIQVGLEEAVKWYLSYFQNIEK